MPHHFTKNTLETTQFCNRCQKLTQWGVSDGRLGRCLNDHPSKKADDEQKRKDAAKKQSSLFD